MGGRDVEEETSETLFPIVSNAIFDPVDIMSSRISSLGYYVLSFFK